MKARQTSSLLPGNVGEVIFMRAWTLFAVSLPPLVTLDGRTPAATRHPDRHPARHPAAFLPVSLLYSPLSLSLYFFLPFSLLLCPPLFLYMCFSLPSYCAHYYYCDRPCGCRDHGTFAANWRDASRRHMCGDEHGGRGHGRRCALSCCPCTWATRRASTGP